ncbi:MULTISPECIES: beta-phosphoglucomutase [unclassified Clostridioides]|uniref:beta-phosphoglucomutase n=1 Tax=unclassified Clostridioides TaxID=2635829 RepID=UPI001D0FC804|nr:beta-phosphoglucomutase [Clostridioides sp. ES-S-0171-01]MCC0689899.1 beta-phosphoglucomutase [Clostridioides sp. ES-S-0056-01]UDN54218.1 beta-phosphoglucomutase [Clostridioides sp. ES-S-0054-01]
MKAVLFDLDGVITDTAKYHFEAWRDIAKSLDIEIDETFNEKLKGISREESLDRILICANKVDSYTKEEKLRMCEEKNKTYIKLIGSLTSKDILPGISKLIKELRENNIKLGIASASKNAPKILESLGIKDEFDCIVNPSLLERGKPYPDIFIEGSKMLNLEQHDCIGIEDSYSGIKAINDANMTSIGVGKKEVLGKCDYIVEDTGLLSYNTLLQVWSKKVGLA